MLEGSLVYCQRPCLNILEANNVSAPPFRVVPRCGVGTIGAPYKLGSFPWGTGAILHQIFQGAKAKGIRIPKICQVLNILSLLYPPPVGKVGFLIEIEGSFPCMKL